ncbi:hypothetical protein [Burkholderia cenocepacia]|uniref:hypothetical protein n=1 Tax=Burkholderia cenocepacia TaxID=95486 RepID=UPI002AB5F0E3|nr:hypothetical protein [Burkholderia cenocepacia]
MSALKIEHPDYELVEHTGAGNGCRTACAFMTPARLGDECRAHACFSDNLPGDHPLRNSERPLVWVRKA